MLLSGITESSFLKCLLSVIESSFDNLVWFIEDVLSTFNMLCYVDPLNGHRAVLQFVEKHIEGVNIFLKHQLCHNIVAVPPTVRMFLPTQCRTLMNLREAAVPALWVEDIRTPTGIILSSKMTQP
ncbi:hypothetical protein Pelo_10341 [Pelomyxa schiedti]|nr:hypothetical protein Pelo_10341 [Pelomyxa schiedti]